MAISICSSLLLTLLILLSHFPSSRKYLLQYDVAFTLFLTLLHFNLNFLTQQMQSHSSESTSVKSPTISLRLPKPSSSSSPLQFRKWGSTAPIPPSSQLWPEPVSASSSALVTETFLLSPPILTPPLDGSTPTSSLFTPPPKSSSSTSATRFCLILF